MNVLVVSSSPRRNGNSRLLAEATLEGAREAGHDAELVHLDDHLKHFLRDCRECRDANGRCTIDDGYPALLRERVLPADGLVFATPIYWYGVETYPGAMLGIVHEIQEYSRYTHSDFVGYVCGIGNKRGDVLKDPADPIGQARDLGRTLFDRVATDYRIDTERAGSTWE